MRRLKRNEGNTYYATERVEYENKIINDTYFLSFFFRK